MNFRISGQKIELKSSGKYLGLVIDEFLNWKTQYTILRTKLERSIGLLAKLRYFVSANLLRTVYIMLLLTRIFVMDARCGDKIKMVALMKFLHSKIKRTE